MVSHRLNSLYAIKECSTCGSLYTRGCCSIRSFEDKIIVPKPDSSLCCAKCGKPVDGPYCRGCDFLRKKFKEDLLTYCGENETSKDFEDISKSSDDNTNVVNAPREPFVINQDPGDSVDCQEAFDKILEELEEIKRDQRILKELKKRITEEQTAKENMSIEEMRHEQQLVDYKIKEIMNALGYKRFRGENIDEEYEKDSITPSLSPEEPVDSLIMEDEHLDTIPETESEEFIKSSVENLVQNPSEYAVLSDGENLSTLDALKDNFEILSDSNNDGTSSDDDDFEDVEYEEVNDVDQEEKEFDLDDIFQIQDVILREKLLNVYRLITNIKSLKVNSTPDRVLKSPSPFPIPVVDSDAFFEESDTSLSHLDNSLTEFETSSDHTEETRSGSTTTHANYSLLEYDSFLFEIEPDQERLISIDNSNNTLLELPEFESFHFDPSFPRPPPKPLDVEILEPGNNNFDDVEEDDSFTFTIRTFLPFVTYPEASPLSCSTRSEDYPDFEDSRAHGFVHSYIRASYPQLHLGNPIS
ncbi:hypothetical protein Tco_1251051 [Tanacetum coccineum]